jgi:hypothetical protein
MRIGITFEVNVKWIDDLLKFQNLNTMGRNLISLESANRLWLPSENFLHDNAVIGEIMEDKHRTIEARNLTEGFVVSGTESVENHRYPGSETQLYMKQRFKVMYGCEFEMTKFPFDRHLCHFKMKLERGKNILYNFIKDDLAVLYQGPLTWNQFKINEIQSNVDNGLESTNFIFSIEFSRLYMNQILNTFLPILLLWSLGYSTLLIETENFSDRFMGTVTALLVLVSLLSSVNEDLPETSYFKLIDLWFLWFLSNILLITIFHIFIISIRNDKVVPTGHRRQLIGDNEEVGKHILRMKVNNKVVSTGILQITDNEDVDKQTLRMKINKVGIVLFAVGTLLFCVGYFAASSIL